MRNQIPEIMGMFQREVGLRIAEPPGSKQRGILSVLIQAYYDVEYCFTVNSKIDKYVEKNIIVFHIDLYRIENEKELNSIGIFEYLESDKLCFIEWPQVLRKYINEKAIRIKINILDEFNREVEITNN